MRRLLLFLLLPLAALAQSTTVSSTGVVDPNGTIWANGSYQITFVTDAYHTPPQYTWSGGKLTYSFTGALSSTGTFSVSIPSNSAISPAGSQWKVFVCPNAAGSCYGSTFPVIGTTMDVTSAINQQLKAPLFNSSPHAWGYNDQELITPPNPGASYFNTTDGSNHCWTGLVWTSCSGVTGTTTSIEHVFSAPGTFTFTHNLGSTFYQINCVTRSGGVYGPGTCSNYPVDANNASVTVPAAGDYIVSFSAVTPPPPDFLLSVVPSSLTYWPTMTGTQAPTFTVTQTATGTYTGTVNYTSSGLAAGMTGSFVPTSIVTSGTTTFTDSFPASQAAATTSFTIQGTDGTKTHTVTPSITVGNLNSGLVECWQMTDGSGSSFADSCGTGNTETLVAGSLTWGSNAGFPGTTATFTGGAYSHGTNQTATNFDSTAPFSVAAWVNLPAIGNEVALVGTLDTANNYKGWELNASPSPTNFCIEFFLINSYPTNAIQVKSAGCFTPSSGVHHLVATYSAATKTASDVVFYLDGTVQTNQPPVQNTLTLLTNNTTKASFMARVDGTDPGSGVMGYVRIWNRVLSAADVTNYYALGPR